MLDLRQSTPAHLEKIIRVDRSDINALSHGVEVSLCLVEWDVQTDHIIFTRHDQAEAGA